MTTCLILAAGNAERHNGGNKPLLKVNGETLLERTARIIEYRCNSKVVVTHKQDIMDNAIACSCSVFIPKERRWVIETLLSSRHAWNEDGDTVIALGDVFYTANAIEMMFDEDIRCAAFGKGCNIHAMRWNSRHHGKLAAELAKSVKSAEEHPQNYGAGKLWTFVACCQPEIPVIDFGDETTDFDSPQEHKRFIEKYASRH